MNWRSIIGYEGIYEVSECGVVRSLPRRVAVGFGKTRSVKERIVTQRLHEQGYRVVFLQMHNRSRGFLVHRLVAAAFIGEIAEKQEVNHKDGNKENNHAVNLEIVDRQANIDHAVANGLIANKGESNSQAKITEEVARAILSDRAMGMGYKKLAKKHGVSWSIARRVATRKTWTHLQTVFG